jgi:apolipoprotein D and lipocalin family protein
MSNIGILALILAFTSHIHAFGDKCSFPDPAKEFTNERYEGRWYEIGKIQTKGGAFFERNCVCTSLDVTIIDKTTGDGIANNDCREKTVDGKWTNVTGTLTDESLEQQGRWLETIYGSPVNYTVIYMDDDYSVEYDCGTSLGITNYCVHILSRTPTMPQEKFDELIQMAEDMGLNSQNLDVSMTLQDGCYDQPNNGMCCTDCSQIEGTAKYWSIDDVFNQCGEACLSPDDYDAYHKFEKNLLPAETNTPCADAGYSNYKQTTTHGNSRIGLEATFDMYTE